MGIAGTLAIAIAALPSLPVLGQPPKLWTAPLTPDGQPDLQGTWVSRSATPLERPKELEGRAFQRLLSSSLRSKLLGRCRVHVH